jgi:hypothetical protein
MLILILFAPPHCSQISIPIQKKRLRFCAQVFDRCFCARVPPCPIGNACLALFNVVNVIVRRCRMIDVNTP